MNCKEFENKNSDYVNEKIRERASDPNILTLAHELYNQNVIISKDTGKILFKEMLKNVTIIDFFKDLAGILDTEFWPYDNPRGLFILLDSYVDWYIINFFNKVIDEIYP
jgi:hypothetical protein